MHSTGVLLASTEKLKLRVCFLTLEVGTSPNIIVCLALESNVEVDQKAPVVKKKSDRSNYGWL